MAKIFNLLILVCSFMNAQPQLYDFSYGEDNRQYYLYTPDSLEAGAALIFVFHGYSGSAAGIMGYSDLNDLADQNGFVVCYPQGLIDDWDYRFWNVGYEFHSNETHDDVGFVKALAYYLQVQYQLSSYNTYSTGMSNGGDMSYLLACQASGQVEVNQQALDASGNPEVLMDVDHAWETDANSAAVTTRAYAAAIPVVGPWIVPVALFFFAFTTIIGWSYYGEQAVTYLIGEWATHPFRYIWVVVVFLGSVAAADWLWLLGDIANASMAFPNLIAILALSGVVAAMHKSNGDPDKGHPVHDYREEERHPEKE